MTDQNDDTPPLLAVLPEDTVAALSVHARLAAGDDVRALAHLLLAARVFALRIGDEAAARIVRVVADTVKDDDVKVFLDQTAAAIGPIVEEILVEATVGGGSTALDTLLNNPKPTT